MDMPETVSVPHPLPPRRLPWAPGQFASTLQTSHRLVLSLSHAARMPPASTWASPPLSTTIASCQSFTQRSLEPSILSRIHVNKHEPETQKNHHRKGVKQTQNATTRYPNSRAESRLWCRQPYRSPGGRRPRGEARLPAFVRVVTRRRCVQPPLSVRGRHGGGGVGSEVRSNGYLKEKVGD